MKKILLIDDDPDFVEITRMVLEREYRVMSASSGVEGLAIARKKKPDLVILDLRLPGEDGVQVCRKLKEVGRAPILVLTAYSQNDVKVRGVRVIEKPVKPAKLLQVVKDLIG